ENAASPSASIRSRAARAMSRWVSAVPRRGCLIGAIFPSPPQRYSVDIVCYHCRLLGHGDIVHDACTPALDLVVGAPRRGDRGGGRLPVPGRLSRTAPRRGLRLLTPAPARYDDRRPADAPRPGLGCRPEVGRSWPPGTVPAHPGRDDRLAGAGRILWHVPLGVALIGLVWALAWGTWTSATWRGVPR